MRLTQIIEALLFASDAPLTAADLARIDERLDEDTVSAVVDELRSEYDLTERSFQIYDVAGGYQILTRPEFVAVLERYDTVPQSTRLSTPALEVLAIIAYRQPLGRSEVEEIRGVQSSAVLRTLQDRGLIEPVGRAEALGRPLLYGTTSRFLDHFGFRSLEDLPRPDELPVVLRTRHVVDGVTDASATTIPPADSANEVAVAADGGAANGGAPDPEAPVGNAPADGQAAQAPEVLAGSDPSAQSAPVPAGLMDDTAAAETEEDAVHTGAVAEEILADVEADLAPAGIEEATMVVGAEQDARPAEEGLRADDADVEPANAREG